MLPYNSNFLQLDGNQALALPTFSYRIAHDDVLRNQPHLTQGFVADYINYSLVMSADPMQRAPMFVALNIDQDKMQNTDRRNNWKIDERIGFENQLDNDYYRNNPWDRGHMARRQSAAWGLDKRDAQRADEETFYYTNSTLQHENLNQDEWLALEDWVLDLPIASHKKITTFSGPFYADFDRVITPGGRQPARVPAGFFKIVCFKNSQTDALDVRAFVIYQDEEALRDKRGRHRFNNQNYQVTVTEIEDLTGLIFDDALYEANPLIYTLAEDDALHDTLVTPERYEIGSPFEIVNFDAQRPTIMDDIVDVFIVAAMVNATGSDQAGEWISIINLDKMPIEVGSWSLVDNSLQALEIASVLNNDNVILNPGESLKVGPVAPLKLANTGDVIRLYDGRMNRIDWVNYSEAMVREGVPVLFLTPRNTLELDVQGAAVRIPSQ